MDLRQKAMRLTTLAFLTALLAPAALAQTAENAPEPDYSKESIMRIFAVETEKKEEPKAFDVGPSAITYSTGDTSFRFNYFSAPFQGSIPGTYKTWPDPFALTGTSIAMSPRAWRDRRARNAELRRIDRLTKPKATIKVKTNATAP